MNEKSASKMWRRIALIAGLGLILRFAALPFTMPVEGDAATRIWTAWRWLENPEFITYGFWGPLYTYLLAFALAIVRDPVYPPIILSILFSVATAVLLYRFTDNEFGSGDAALFVSILYLFYPVAMRSSLTAMTETPFAFFVTLTLFLLSVVRKDRGSWVHALGAGLSLTLAGMLRYEGWLLIPLMALSLWKKPRLMVVFGAAALLFPAFWMISSAIHTGDALYSMHWNQEWELVTEGSNENVTTREMVKRFAGFPLAIFLGLTPFVALMAAAGAVMSALKRERRAIWLIPFLGVFGFFSISAIPGWMEVLARYSISMGVMLLPYCAVVYEAVSLKENVRRWAALAVVATMIPFSFAGNLIAPRQLGGYYRINYNVVPRLTREQDVSDIRAALAGHLDTAHDGLISDFFGWDRTYVVVLTTRMHPDQIFVAPGARYEELDEERLDNVLAGYGSGVLLLQEGSRFADLVEMGEDGQAALLDHVLSLEVLEVIESEDPDMVLYRYQVIN